LSFDAFDAVLVNTVVSHALQSTLPVAKDHIVAEWTRWQNIFFNQGFISPLAIYKHKKLVFIYDLCVSSVA